MKLTEGFERVFDVGIFPVIGMQLAIPSDVRLKVCDGYAMHVWSTCNCLLCKMGELY